MKYRILFLAFLVVMVCSISNSSATVYLDTCPVGFTVNPIACCNELAKTLCDGDAACEAYIALSCKMKLISITEPTPADSTGTEDSDSPVVKIETTPVP